MGWPRKPISYNTPLQKWLDDKDILMYLTHNEGKSVVAERFIKSLKTKTYKKLTVSDNKSFLGYLNELVDKCNNTYQRSIGKTLWILIILLWLNRMNLFIKLLILKLVIVLQLLSTRIFLAKIKLKIGKEKTNQIKYKIKIFERRKKSRKLLWKRIVVV